MEIWKDVPGYEGMYKVSNVGNILSLRKIDFNGKIRKEKLLKPSINKYGYGCLDFKKNGIRKGFTVHQLVAMAFLNHIPNNHKMVVDHKNNNPKDNRLENLQVITNRLNLSKDKQNKSSKYTGVCWNDKTKKWRSSIVLNGKYNHLGTFDNEIQAKLYYDNALISFEKNEKIITKKKVSKAKGIYWMKTSKKWRIILTLNGVKKAYGDFEIKEIAEKKLKTILNEKTK